MEPTSVTRTRFALPTALLAAIAFSLLLLPPRALAALGEDQASVEVDRRQFRSAKLSTRASASYTTHEFYSEHGTAVREYVSADGKIFGVAWEGPHIPELPQILGSYYDEFERGAAEVRRQRMRGPLVIAAPGLVVESGGHMRAFRGKAYIPAMLPAGVGAGEIR
jgi:hypothetical protein